MAEEEPDAVLSDVDDDPAPVELSAGRTSSPTPSTSDDAAAALAHRVRDLQAELDLERQGRKAAEDARADLQNAFGRLKALAHEALRKRDEALREKEEAARSAERAAAELAESARAREEIVRQVEEATRQVEEAARQREASRAETETAVQMLVSGIEKVSGKVGGFANFAAGGLPRSNKYSAGLPAVAYGVIKRANEIVEELVRQVDGAGKARDEAREQVEHRNYEIAIEVSQLEATIAGLREDVSQKSSQVENLEKSVVEKDGRITEMDEEISQLRQFGEECEAKWKTLQSKLESQRPVVMEQLNYISRAHEQITEIIKNTVLNEYDRSEFSESQFMWKEMDIDNLRTSLEGTVSICELANVAAEKVRASLEERRKEVEDLTEAVSRLRAEKSHIGTLLRSALSSKLTVARQVTANGLREDGLDHKFTDDGKQGGVKGEEDEVYTLVSIVYLVEQDIFFFSSLVLGKAIDNGNSLRAFTFPPILIRQGWCSGEYS
ncbi:hypothetical protein Taro_034504 [Colocasia esculenta]|uniref:Uncharacterized protein n=1 Tax=Colocasia esculenta TaxID=4460 RepID=A0A843WFN7_COLES|nr:hypothetical protein [Colocasia esculenta]